LEREGEKLNFNPLKLKNHRLLWHGSRFSNYVGILSQGLRIAPPEAPRSGYLYGKGVYFADYYAKSINYCRAGCSNGTALLLLCQVALGTPVTKKTCCSVADLEVKKSKKYDSCFAVGSYGTEEKEAKTIVEQGANGREECQIPCGRPKNLTNTGGYGYNEFIVYNTNQIKMKYLVKVK